MTAMTSYIAECFIYLLLTCINCLSIISFINYSTPMSAFIYLLTLYYISEYLLTLSFNKANLSSFLFSIETKHFQFIIFSIVEHLIRNFYFPYSSLICNNNTFFKVSFSSSIIFLSLRIIARLTLGANFTHEIRCQMKPGHKLYTRGIYSVLRHPGYTSWYYWNISMQMLLGNLFSLGLAVFVPMNFFGERIKFEEEVLEEFFAEDYKKYKENTWVLIPKLKIKR